MHLARVNRPASTLTFPPEVLGRIFALTTLPGQTFGGSAPGASFTTSEGAAPLALVCRNFYWEAQRELYRAPVLTTSDAAAAFAATLQARPEFSGFTRDLVIGLSGDEDDDDPRETSQKMVQAVNACTALSRLHILPLHFDVRDDLFAALRDKPLTVVVWAPSPPSTLALQWGESLLQPTDNFVHPSLWYLELHSRVRLQVEGTAGFQLRPGHLHSHFQSTPRIAPTLTHLRLHFDLDAAALHRLLTRCPCLEAFDIYLERRYTPVDTHALAVALGQIGPALKYVTWVTNPTLEDVQHPPTPLFDYHLLGKLTSLRTLSATCTDIEPTLFRLLPPTLAHLELHSFEEPGVFGINEHILAALRDPFTNFGELKMLVVHDELEWWGQNNVDALERACRMRNIAFEFIEDEED